MEKARPCVHVCALQCAIHARTIRLLLQNDPFGCSSKLAGLVFLQHLTFRNAFRNHLVKMWEGQKPSDFRLHRRWRKKGGNILAGTNRTGILFHSSLMAGHDMKWKEVLHKIKLFKKFCDFFVTIISEHLFGSQQNVMFSADLCSFVLYLSDLPSILYFSVYNRHSEKKCPKCVFLFV